MRTEADRIQEALRIFKERPTFEPSLCACLGPRNGEPECWCKMRFILKVDGIYYRIQESKPGNELTATRY